VKVKDQLRLRSQRNYDRYMRVTKRLVEAQGPEHLRWQQESAEESQRDAEWTERHGPVTGGATFLQWRPADEELASVENDTSAQASLTSRNDDELGGEG
jgi:hypothetical protein